jgi:hypothetical protein
MNTLTAERLTAATTARAAGRRRERIFYTGMSAAFLLVVFAGFARSYYLKPLFGTPPPLTPLLHLHGLLFSAWIVLLLAQASLIAAGRTATHRRLGVGGGVLAASMVAVGAVTSVIRAKLFVVPPGENPLTFLTVPLGDLLVFSCLVGAALYLRRRADAHKRLMMLATIALLPAAVGRLPFDFFLRGGPLVFFGIPDLFILPLLAFDLFTRGRPHRATVAGGLLLVASHPLRLVVGHTAAWLSFAEWLTRWS